MDFLVHFLLSIWRMLVHASFRDCPSYDYPRKAVPWKMILYTLYCIISEKIDKSLRLYHPIHRYDLRAPTALGRNAVGDLAHKEIQRYHCDNHFTSSTAKEQDTKLISGYNRKPRDHETYKDRRKSLGYKRPPTLTYTAPGSALSDGTPPGPLETGSVSLLSLHVQGIPSMRRRWSVHI